MACDTTLSTGEKCGRCSWWEGERKIDGANNLWLENSNARCANPRAYGGSHPATSMHTSCPEFELWNRLR